MKKARFAILLSSAFLLLSACGKNESNSSSKSEETKPESSLNDSTSIESAESKVDHISSSTSANITSTSSNGADSNWQPWSNELKAAVEGMLEKARAKEPNVVANTIRNGSLSNGESSYQEYSFKKGKRSNGELACYSKSATQTTYYYYEDGEMSGYIEKSSGGQKTYSKASSINENRFNGYDMSSLMVKSGNGFCGGYASLEMMVENGISNLNNDTKFIIRDDGFDMSYAIYSKTTYTYWNAYISSTFSSDGTLTNLVYKYAESYAKNVDKHEDGTFTFKADAQLDYKETIYQSEAGELGLLNLPVEPSTFNYSSFDVYSGSTKIEDESTVTAELSDAGVVLDVRNALPTTASTNFDEWVVTVQKEGGKATSDGNYFDAKTSKLILESIRDAGTYAVSIKTKNIEKHFTLTVGALHAQSISFIGLVQQTGGMSTTEVKSTIAIGDSTNICAMVNPIGASQEINMEIIAPAGVAASDYTATEKTYKASGITLKYYTFSSTKPGAFQFKATSVDDPSVTYTHTITVSSVLSGDALYSGKYCRYEESIKGLTYVFEFEPDTSTSKQGDGEVTITDARNNRFGVYTYVMSSNGKSLTLTYKKNVDGAHEDLFEPKIASDGTRGSLEFSYKEDPVGWPTKVKLLDWPDYIARYQSE